MPDQNYLDDLRLAHMMADNADSLTMSRFKALDLQVIAKPDLTPVSEADVAVEDAITRTLQTARPPDSVHREAREDTQAGRGCPDEHCKKKAEQDAAPQHPCCQPMIGVLM